MMVSELSLSLFCFCSDLMSCWHSPPALPQFISWNN